MIKHIIFDIGGVLVYPRLGEWNIPYKAADILGSRANDIGSDKYMAAYKKAVVYLDESQLISSTREEYILREKFICTLNQEMNWNMTSEEIAALTEDFTYNIDRYGFFEDIKPWLENWKNKYSMALLSDALPSILLFIEQYGISHYFDAKIISAHVGATKPDPQMYKTVLDALKAKPDECVFIDDRVCNIEAAKRAGIHTVQMARSEFMPDQIWNGLVAHSFEELNTILESGELF